MPDVILSEEEQMLQSTLRNFIDNEIAPKAKESDEKGEFQWDNWRGLADLGLTGLGIDTKYLSLIHISEPTTLLSICYCVFCV